MTASRLTSRFRPTPKYSSRQGHRPEKVIFHHTGGTSDSGNEKLLADDLGYKVSAHYVLLHGPAPYAKPELVNLVSEAFRAWTTGWEADKNAITVETVNTTGAPGWEVSPAQIEVLAQLAADCSRRYGWGTLTRQRVTFHREFMATACPGPYIWDRRDAIVARANEILAAGAPKPPQPAPPSSGIYTVVVGDTLYEIAERFLGDGNRYLELAKANGLGNPNVLRVGQKINVLIGKPSAPAPAKPPAAVKSVTTIAREVIDGKWGNGDDRVRRLRAAGYNYDAVQAEVNRLLRGGSAPAPVRKSVSVLATEVLQGKWGNGTDRKRRLEAAGYNYSAVQAEVNRRL